MFKLENVKYKDVLDIESLEIEAGKINCVLGKSGSGKTTLLKLLNNLISCDSGRILYQGQDINQLDPIALRREVLMLAQQPVIYEGTIRENMLLALEFNGRSILEEKYLGEALHKVGLEKELTSRAAYLSGGEKQRLALARILLLSPTILLLDEPSSALDEETEEWIIKMVVDYIKQQQGTLVMVTHSRKIADKYGQRIIRVEEGRIKE